LAGDTAPSGRSVVVLGATVDLAVVSVLGVVVVALRGTLHNVGTVHSDPVQSGKNEEEKMKSFLV